MHCPLCENTVLKTTRLEKHLNVAQCPLCLGILLNLSDYLYYLSCHEALTADVLEEVSVPVESDNRKALLCPDCQGFLLKYTISSAGDIKIDYCGRCQSVWLDKGEWHYLKEIGMHAHLNKIFTMPWQRKIRLSNSEKSIEGSFKNKLGDKDYMRLKEINGWINDHPEKAMLLAYLSISN